LQTLIRQNRDLRIDFFRGFALWCIFIDHLIKGWLRAVTIKEYGFCDGAELFVLLSGISAGIVYQKVRQRDGLLAAWVKIGRRIAAIYRVHLIMFMLVIAMVGVLVARMNPPSFLEFLSLDTFYAHPFHSVLNVVLLREVPKYFDILPLYIVLLLLFGLTLPLLRWPRLLLGGSVLLYVATRTFQLNLGHITDGWYFDPLAWQVLFLIGVTVPYILKVREYWRGWDWLAVLFSLFSLFESHVKYLVHRVPAYLLIHFEVDKPMLHPFKLVAMLAFAWLAWRHVPATAHWLQARWAEPLVLMGQHSLGVFASSVVFDILGEAILTTYPGFVSQFLVQIIGTAAMVAAAAIPAWTGRAVSAKSRPGQPLATAAEPSARVLVSG
jgi:hypothetical protein